MELPEATVKRIEEEAIAFGFARNTDNSESAKAYKSGCSFGYANGATSEAKRSMILLEALDKIRTILIGCYMNVEAAMIDKAISSYNNQNTES